jgi:hypothetical protein
MSHVPASQPDAPSVGYASFLLRCWDLEGDRRRIQIEHIQTGAATRVATLAAAAIWMRTVAAEAGRRAVSRPPAAERPHTTPGKGEDMLRTPLGGLADDA